MARTPEARRLATQAVGRPVAEWIEHLRTTGARLTYPQIARILDVEHGVQVADETVRTWHRTPEAEPTADTEAGAA